MSGFEVAGVVLAVLPFFNEALKPYGTYATAARRALTPFARDKGLEEFYRALYWDLFLFSRKLEKLVNALPGLSPERKDEIIQSTDMDDWDKGQDLARALQSLLGVDVYDAFQVVMGQILDLLTRLIEDKTVHISKGEINNMKMLQKLKNFKSDCETNSTSSSFSERFRFLKAKRRLTYQKNLHTWIKRLDEFTSWSYQAAEKTRAVMPDQKSKGPSTRLRVLSKRLFSAISRCWSCDCKTPHEARFSIATCGSNGENDLRVTFDFLISHNRSAWCEGVVAMEHAGTTKPQHRAEFDKICDAMTSGVKSDRQRTQLLVENSETAQRIWRLDMQDIQSQYSDAFPTICFKTLMTHPKPPLLERRQLALTFAYSLMQLHESPWLSDQWSGQQMHFFRKASGAPDLRRPFLNASFDQFPKGPEPGDVHLHPNSGILRLGILLVEIHKWKCLEQYREDSDLKDGNPTSSTDKSVAERLLEKLRAGGDCHESYTSAIAACLTLKVDWAPAKSRISLNDAQTWSGMYHDIVEPLENEVAFALKQLGKN